jgi:hypothetical protein
VIPSVEEELVVVFWLWLEPFPVIWVQDVMLSVRTKLTTPAKLPVSEIEYESVLVVVVLTDPVAVLVLPARV